MPYNVKMPKPQGAEEVSALQMFEWNNTVFADSIDPTISFMESRDALTENLRIFTLNESNKLEAINAGAFEPETLAAMAAAGRLFVRKEGEMQLRQFGFAEGGGDVRVILSEPFSDLSALPAPVPAQQNEPEAPAFWKYLLYPFFRNEIREYNQEMEVYEQQMAQYVKETERYTAMTSPDVLDSFDIACGKEPRSQVKSKESSKSEQKTIPEVKIADAKTNVKEETLGAFALRLNGYSQESATVTNVFFKLHTAPTEETIRNEMLNVVRRVAATQILDRANANNGASWDEVMQQGKGYFDAMMHDMKAFLPTLIDPNDMNALVGKSLGEADPQAIIRLNNVAEGALDQYHEQLQKENAERQQNDQQLKQEDPQLQQPQDPAKTESRVAGLS